MYNSFNNTQNASTQIYNKILKPLHRKNGSYLARGQYFSGSYAVYKRARK